MLQNIPDELKAYPQWVCVDSKKRPYNPRTGELADINKPDTWVTFEEAAATAKLIGFVLTVDDPYCLIDIDNKIENPATEEEIERHKKIYESFDSYSETSISGRGCHIIIKGAIPTGIDRNHVGVYSQQRYMIMTGNVTRNAPINDYNELVNQLYIEATKHRPIIQAEDCEQEISDEELIRRAMIADNKDKFIALCRGNITGYPSQSEADFALLAMLCYYSPNNDQVKRIFRMSELGKRKKADRQSYLDNSIQQIRASKPPKIDFSKFKLPQEAQLEEPELEYSLPPGLLGELATYFYHTVIRPVPEVALASAMGFMAGIAGRAYNISGTGLNQYIILLAQTGVGKEGALSGIENLLAHIRPHIPTCDQILGPAAFASGQAIIKVLAERPCIISVLGEFGLTLQQISHANASSSEVMVRRVLLDLYAKSGWNKLLQPSVYSDTTRNTRIIQAPCLTIFGESTPERFFDALDLSHVQEGLIPRFSVIEYKGDRPPRNPDAGMPPPDSLTQRVIGLFTTAQAMQANARCLNVALDTRAKELLDAFDLEADKRINKGDELSRQLWNRAHLKALKMSALIAVGIDWQNPVVNEQAAKWALDFVRRDINSLSRKFESGDIGKGDVKQVADVRTVLKRIMSNESKDKQIEIMRRDGIVSHRALLQRVHQLASFRNDRIGGTNAFKRAIQVMIDSGEIIAVKDKRLAEKYDYHGLAYGVLCNTD